MAELTVHLLLTAIYSQTFRKRLLCVRLMLILELFLAQEPTVLAKGWVPSSRLHRLTPPAAEMIALSVKTWSITQLLGYSYYYCRHTKIESHHPIQHRLKACSWPVCRSPSLFSFRVSLYYFV